MPSERLPLPAAFAAAARRAAAVARAHPRTAGSLAAVVVLAAILVAVQHHRATRREAVGERPTFTVRRGPLTISIVPSGTIEATEQETITSEVEGQTTIIQIVEEGTRVNAGDLLVELDASTLQDRLLEQQIGVQNAESEFVQAREALAVTTNQSASDVSLAELKYRFAREDLVQYTEGEYKQALLEAESKITLAEEELQLASRKLEWSEQLLRENYIAQSERDADRLSFNRAKLDLDLARAAKTLLETYTRPREVAQLESDVVESGQALERARLKASADIIQAEAEASARSAELTKQQTKERKLRDQIAKTRIVAPRAGLVVYATSARMSWRGSQEPLAAGQSVRERQELIYLPTADRMMAVVQVHESNLDKVRLGLPVIVTVDALQGRTFIGKVTRIAPLPDAASVWMNPDLKVYRTEIQLDGTQPELRTGMSCMAEIVVDRYDDAVYVPVQAVVRVNGAPTAYLLRGGHFVPVPVEVGLDNNQMVRILSGLDVGQTVLLTPPLQEAALSAADGPGGDGPDGRRVRALLEESRAPVTPAPPAPPAAGPPEAAPADGRDATPTGEADRPRRRPGEERPGDGRRDRPRGGGEAGAGTPPPGGRP